MHNIFPEELFQQQMQKLISAVSLPQLQNMFAYTLLPGGKLIRPRFSWAIYQDLAPMGVTDLPAFVELLPALELIHVSTLIHDDLPAIDNDDLRRGKPSCHKEFGEGVAILGANFMQSYALEGIFRSSFTQEIQVKSAQVLARAYSLINLGQILDLKNQVASILDYQAIVENKTAALFEAAGLLATNVIRLSDDSKSIVANFASSYGVLFQINNDWLEHSGNIQEVGRVESSDKRNEKINIFSEQFANERQDYLEKLQNNFQQAFNEVLKINSHSKWQHTKDFCQSSLSKFIQFK